MSIIRTDYGLIYNTDGSLCATLLPGSGVSIAEGTTNLIPVNRQKFEGWVKNYEAQVTITQGISVPEWNTNQATRIQTVGGTALPKYFYRIVEPSVDGQDYSLSVRIKNIGVNPVVVSLSIGESVTVDPGETKEVQLFMVGNGVDNFTLRLGASSVDDSLDFIAYQPMAEEKPFCTPFVEGTRPAGILPYPDVAKRLNQREFTFVAEWKPYTKLGAAVDGYNNRIFHMTGAGAWVILYREANARGIVLSLPDAEGVSVQRYTFTPSEYEAYQWHFIAVMLDIANGKCYIRLNDESQEFMLEETPLMPTEWQNFYFGSTGNARGQLNGELKNVLIRPYAVSAETIATWHSLDAPFYDPREQIDSAGRPVHGAGWNADQNGLRSNLIIPETNRPAFEIEPSGNAYFGGELRAGIVVDESVSNDSTIAKLYSTGRISMPIGLWSDNTYGYDVLLPDVIDFDKLGVVVNYFTWAGIGELRDGVWKIPTRFPMYTYNLNTGVYTLVPTQTVESAVVLNMSPRAWWQTYGQTSGDRVRLEAAVIFHVVVGEQTLAWYSIRHPTADAGVHIVDYFIAIKQYWG